MTRLILSNEYLCVIFILFGEKKFLFKQNICMLFKCSIDTETAHQLLSNYSQMTSCIEFINLSPEPIQNNFNITLRILQNMYLFIFMKNFDQVKWTKKPSWTSTMSIIMYSLLKVNKLHSWTRSAIMFISSFSGNLVHYNPVGFF